MTDLKAAAEAAKYSTFDFEAIRAAAEVQPSVNVDSKLLLALIRERDEARKERDDLAQSLKHIMVADRDAAEAALSAAREEVEKVRAALADYHAALKNREHGGVAAGRFVDAVTEALTKETPHG